nr:hypothetical protein CFP56_76478 [Quercus suber]
MLFLLPSVVVFIGLSKTQVSRYDIARLRNRHPVHSASSSVAFDHNLSRFSRLRYSFQHDRDYRRRSDHTRTSDNDIYRPIVLYGSRRLDNIRDVEATTVLALYVLLDTRVLALQQRAIFWLDGGVSNVQGGYTCASGYGQTYQSNAGAFATLSVATCSEIVRVTYPMSHFRSPRLRQ